MTKPSPKAPPLCPMIYRDHDTLYLDFGTFVQPFVFTEGGLSKCLKHIPNIAGPRGGHHPGRSNLSAKLTTTGHIARVTKSRSPKVIARQREILNLPDGMREAALAIVKRKGMDK